MDNDQVQLSPPKKRVRRHLSTEDKTSVINIFKTYANDQPENSKVQNVAFTAQASGIGTASVYNVLKEYNSNNHTVQPPRKYHRSRAIMDNVTEEEKNLIRRIVHSFFLRNEPPTLDKVLHAVNECDDLPNFKRTTFRKILLEINFRFKGRSRNSILKEKNEIIAWRRHFLRQMKKFRQENRKIYYLDETWINSGHTVNKVWTDMSVTNPRDAFLRGLTTGLKNPSGKGGRFIILHIGSDDGFVEDGLIMFQSKKNGDYHEEMNANLFEEWFQNILPSLEENAIIVMDNASYHSRQVEKCPTSAMKKADIQQWLRSKCIPFEDDMVKAELLHLVKQNKPIKKQVVDEMAKQRGRHVERLPPYHCELNPIELIWAQVKGEVARKNTTFKMKDVEKLFQEALNNVTPQNWQNCIRHVLKIELDMWKIDVIMETQVEPLIINLEESSDSDSDVGSSDNGE